jgi:3-dehydroquinate synthase
MNSNTNSQVEVCLGDRSYNIEIGRGLESSILQLKSDLVSRGEKVVIISDQGLRESNPSFLHSFFESTDHLILPSGEKTKSSENLIQIWDFLASHRIDRSSAVFAVGGGVAGDLGGFASATFLRGISLYQVPTTLLSMVDSSVGGKTGINLKAGKNLVGSFHQPKAVFIDLDVLATLPSREFSAGMAEVVKYGMIGNPSLYKKITGRDTPFGGSTPELQGLIHSCCSEKAKVVEVDEKESTSGVGGRALLNLGHTFAHAIEAVAGYGDYLHGEAVSVGLLCAFRLSQAYGLCKQDKESELTDTLSSYNLPVRLKKDLPVSELMSSMHSDKKVFQGKLRFVLMHTVGQAFVQEDIQLRKVEEIWASVGAV